MITYALFFAGFVALIKGADWLVEGASALAKRMGVSNLVIGLTIVSFGTSAPELVVNILASLEGSVDIAIGNITGSNIANILLILGVSSMIYPLSVQTGTVWREIPFALLAVTMVTILANDALIDGATASVLTRIDGFVLLGFFIIFLYYMIGIAKQSVNVSGSDDEVENHSYLKSFIMVLAGTIGLVLGGKWIVAGAVTFATAFGVSEALIGLTIVAIGTSLPELATSAVAALRRDVDIAVGNVIGSNIFNVFWILGVSALIRPLSYDITLNSDLLMSIAVTLLLFVALFIGRHNTLDRWEGGLFVLVYIVYMVFLVLRG